MRRVAVSLKLVQNASTQVHIVGENSAPNTAFWLHGLLGDPQNWLHVARSLCRSMRGEWKFVLPRIRNHGLPCTGYDSQVLPPHTVAGCARDLQVLSEELDMKPDMIVGHSFGGKVALEYMRMLYEQNLVPNAPEHSIQPLPHTIMLLDTIPGVMDRCVGAGGLHGDCLERVLLGLAERYEQNQQHQQQQQQHQPHQLRQCRVEIVDEVLDRENAPEPLRLWIKSLLTGTPQSKLRSKRRKQGQAEAEAGAGVANSSMQTLTFDPRTAHELLVDYASTDCLPVLHRLAGNGHGQSQDQGHDPCISWQCCAVHVMAAEHSERWRGGALQEIEQLAMAATPLPDGRSSVQVHILPRSGHTLFADNPADVIQYVKEDLQQLDSRV